MFVRPGSTPAAPSAVQIHAGYLVLTGAWPLLHYRSFEAVTGDKTDTWLVRTVGAVATVLGLALLTSHGRRSRLLSTATTAAFAASEVPPALRGRIRPIYLLDAALQASLTAAAFRQSDASPRPVQRGLRQ